MMSVTTRRLVHIVNAYRMFGDKLKSIQMCISRFDEETRNSILDLYTKIDAGVDLNEENPVDESETSEYNEDYDVWKTRRLTTNITRVNSLKSCPRILIRLTTNIIV